MPKYLITRSQYHEFVVEAKDGDEAMEKAERLFEEEPWEYDVFWDGELLKEEGNA